MPRLGELEARVASISELDDIVGAMRALAAVRMRQALDCLRATRAHAETIRAALDAARTLLPEHDTAPVPPPERSGPEAGPLGSMTRGRIVVVFCTEHGFAGAFNEHVFDRVIAGGRGPLVVVGSRGVSLAKERGLEVVAGLAAPSHPSGVLEVSRRAAATITARLDRERWARADVIYGRGTGTGTGSPPIETAQLLPVPPSTSRASPFPPLHHLQPNVLFEQLLGEYVVAELARIAMESLAAESAARMQAMSASRDNIERKLSDLRRAEHRARQDQVTTELLDLITGAEASR